jgi:hypothetical protein
VKSLPADGLHCLRFIWFHRRICGVAVHNLFLILAWQTGQLGMQQALALAETLGIRPLQAHYHRGLGTLYVRTSQHQQARTELPTAIEMYRAMDMTLWLPQAEAALALIGRVGLPSARCVVGLPAKHRQPITRPLQILRELVHNRDTLKSVLSRGLGNVEAT